MTVHADKVNSVREAYISNREMGDTHDQAESRVYKLAADQQIDSFQLREGISSGQRAFEKAQSRTMLDAFGKPMTSMA